MLSLNKLDYILPLTYIKGTEMLPTELIGDENNLHCWIETAAVVRIQRHKPLLTASRGDYNK